MSRYQSTFAAGSFAGQVIIVTGGGSGIGRCTAHELASLGATVAIMGRNPEKLAIVREELVADGAGGRVSTHVCDIRDEAQVIAAVDKVIADHGRIDGLVNNAGGQYRAGLETITTKGFEAVVKNNLTGGFIFMREVYNRYLRDHGGSIVNIIADISNGWPNFAHSGAARGGMLTLSESAACEWAESGVRVNTVAPGCIATSGFDKYDASAQADIAKYAERVPLRRFGTEAEVSAAIVFLLSAGASYITGTCVRVDGGVPNARQTHDLTPHERSKPYNGFHRAVLPRLLSSDVDVNAEGKRATKDG